MRRPRVWALQAESPAHAKALRRGKYVPVPIITSMDPSGEGAKSWVKLYVIWYSSGHYHVSTLTFPSHNCGAPPGSCRNPRPLKEAPRSKQSQGRHDTSSASAHSSRVWVSQSKPWGWATCSNSVAAATVASYKDREVLAAGHLCVEGTPDKGWATFPTCWCDVILQSAKISICTKQRGPFCAVWSKEIPTLPTALCDLSLCTSVSTRVLTASLYQVDAQLGDGETQPELDEVRRRKG